MQNNTQTRYHINSLARGLKILELLAQSREPLTLSRIAADMALTLPTVYRFLFTLESLGYVDKDPDMKSYRVSPKVLALGYGAFQSSDLWQTAHPYLLRVSRDQGETFNLAILDGTDILYIDRIKTQKILTINLEIGSKTAGLLHIHGPGAPGFSTRGAGPQHYRTVLKKTHNLPYGANHGSSHKDT